ncbi:MAG TPA: low molecular weight phosphatase family protein [Verrucomicrobiae bacterium]|nr:low molecular weight phosphatase family protein [Verrucomicrobiae bacterium]
MRIHTTATGVDDHAPTAEQQSPSRPGADVLFLCTGNYYRSRFAEELFNHLAVRRRIPLRAHSLGFTPHPDTNPGFLSTFAIAALAERNIAPASTRMPQAVKAADFITCRRCIAMSETEHRPIMECLFPSLIHTVQFWSVEDLAWEQPHSALGKIESSVAALMSELVEGASSPTSAAAVTPS